MVKILTLNVGLLDYKVCGGIVFSNPPYSNQRLPYIPDAILAYEPDIVCLQECYYSAHVEFIVSKLKHMLPYHARKNTHKRGILNMHNGMLILSRYPITNVEIISHRCVACVEDWFGDKSTLIATIDVPNYGFLKVINIHPTAGGTDPESAQADANRQRTLQDIVDFYLHTIQGNEGFGAIIVGDFNCGPDVSPKNFEFIMKYGFRDTFQEAIFNGVVPNEQHHTWDSKNLLNADGVHAHQDPQRIDHVLLPTKDSRFGRILSGEIIFTEKKVIVPHYNKETKQRESLSSISDHYGLIIDVEIVPANLTTVTNVEDGITAMMTAGEINPISSQKITEEDRV
jgi:endonuclease/exonuclease/phosphatase family metal-dependent hydrolase